MKVAQLMELLEAMDSDAEVMIAHQPSWPLAEVLSGCTAEQDREQVCPEHPDYLVGHGMPGPDGTRLECHEGEDVELDPTVWLIAGGHHWDKSPYAPRWLWEDN